MKPPIEFRPGPRLKTGDVVTSDIPGFERMVVTATSDEILAHKRSMKAAQMRRYRARKASKA
jgi:hypothetical protein